MEKMGSREENKREKNKKRIKKIRRKRKRKRKRKRIRGAVECRNCVKNKKILFCLHNITKYKTT